MLANMSIAKKLYVGFGVVLVIILALVLSSWRGFDQVNDTVKTNIHTYNVLDEVNSMVRGLMNIEAGTRGFALTGLEPSLQPLKDGEKIFDESRARFKQLTSDNPIQQKRIDELSQLESQWFNNEVMVTINLRRQVVAGAQPMDAVIKRVSDAPGKAQMEAMRKIIADVQEEEQRLMVIRTEDMSNARSTALSILIGGGLLSVVLAIGVALTLSRTIVGRLHQAVDIAKAIADGRLNTTIQKAGRDEIGTLFDAFSGMQERLRTMITQIKEGAEQLVGAAQNISSTSSQLSVSSHEQSQAASLMAATVEELTVSINHVSDNANEALAISTDSGRQSLEGSNVIQSTLSSMQLIAETVQTSANQIGELGQHSEQISSIVNVIKGIAEQTNLLALNAAIEAARAGEQGRGFAVVADEVRLLSQRTANSTQEITDMVVKIQGGTTHAVSSMDIGVNQVNQGVELANRAGDAIVNIRTASDNVIEVVNQISLALREQSAASQDVARNVELIAHMSQQNSQAVEETSETARTLEQLAKHLEQQVAVFRL